MSTLNSSTYLQRPLPRLSKLADKYLAKPLTNMNSFGAYLEPVIQVFSPNWRYNTISANVRSLEFESTNIYTITLKPDKKWQTFYAGQFIQLTIEKDGSFYNRHFSISSSPRYFEQTGQIQLSIRTQEQGLITPWLPNHLVKGSTVYLSPAMGEFTLKPAIHTSPSRQLFIAAGSGITPIKSMLSEHKGSNWYKDACLIFYVRNHSELLFKEELAEFASAGLNVKVIYTEECGRICPSHLNEFADYDKLQECYICGPAEMIDSSISLLKAMGTPSDQLHYEYFGPAPKSHLPESPLLGFDQDGDDEVIQVDYLSSKMQVQFNAETFPKTLLDIAEQEGLKPTAGCRMGVCHQCICKKKQGRVFNTKTKQYSDTGEEEIQLCISVPVGHVELEL